MNFIPSQVGSGLPFAASTPYVPKHEQLDEVLRALAIPFDLAVIQWRVPTLPFAVHTRTTVFTRV
jgi:hypothetical protein